MTEARVAGRQGFAEDDALAKDMAAKSAEFAGKGSEVYAKF